MANVKFSQFTSAASLSATGQIVGFDGVNNIRLTKAALEGSLDLGNLTGSIDLATQSTGSIDISTRTTGDLPLSRTTGTLDASTDLSGVLAETNGGTGQTAPYLNTQIDYRSVRTDYWGGTGSFPYGNVARATKYAMGTELNLIDYTTHPTSSGITYAQTTSGAQALPAGVTAFGTGGEYSKWTVEQGTYEISVQSFFYDNFSDVDTTVSIWLGVGGSWSEEYILIKQSTAEGNDSRLFQGSRVVTTFAAGWEFMVTLLFENGVSDPFPYNASAVNFPLTVTIKRI